jgi:hypothetical protein
MDYIVGISAFISGFYPFLWLSYYFWQPQVVPTDTSIGATGLPGLQPRAQIEISRRIGTEVDKKIWTCANHTVLLCHSGRF